MTAADLITQARQAGLHIAVRDGQLHVRGPNTAETLARTLLARKADILAALTCRVCADPLDPVLAEDGTHPSCDPTVRRFTMPPRHEVDPESEHLP